MGSYEEKVTKFESQLEKHWKVISDSIEENGNIDELDEIQIKSLKTQIVTDFREVDRIATEFRRFLENTRTKESIDKDREIADKLISYRQITNDFLRSLNQSDAKSSSSRTSSQARLRAAKARVAFAEEQAYLEKKRADVERQKAELEIDLKLLQQKREAALTEAECESVNEIPELPETTKKQLTAEFINNLPDNVNVVNETASDLTKFLLKKDLLYSRITSFNDQPENYNSWRQTFKAVMSEISASPSEEIDMLIKWLGPTSKRQALSLKSAYITDPVEGLNKVWTRLDERFGSPESVYHATMKRLSAFPKIPPRNPTLLYDLSDLLSEIEGLKTNPKFSTILSYFDAAIGINPIVCKLPHNIQEKWTAAATRYKEVNDVAFPPFSEFSKFIRQQSKIRNDPSFHYETESPTFANRSTAVNSCRHEKPPVTVKKTSVPENKCPIHRTPHTLQECRVFQEMPYESRRKLLSEKRLCFKCYSSQHVAKECGKDLSHSVYQSDIKRNSGASGYDKNPRVTPQPSVFQGGEQKPTVSASCTEIEICESQFCSKSCSKIVLANVYSENNSDHMTRCYCIIDEQSNRSLIKPELFSLLGITGDNYEYVLKTCGGSKVVSGRRASNVVVESLDGSCSYTLPTLIECSDIPNDKNEICTPDNARCHDHLKNIADYLPDFDAQTDVLLLLGRDVIEAHHVFDQVLGPPGAPFAQRLGLGWVVVGELCLGQMHVPTVVNVNKTYVLDDGRTSLFQPCCDHVLSVKDPLFIRTPSDDKVSLSIDDREFLSCMDEKVHKNSDGSWVAPLPLRSDRPRLPNNKTQAVRRTESLLKGLEKDPGKKTHFFEFMDKLFKNKHAELAPDLGPNEECWYLPIFGVYHPKKPSQVRVVFDSSAKFEGISLNSVLLQGPDFTNSLLGVLLRFRKDKIAIVADIEQMFYSFSVEESHRNLIRFFWFLDNDPSKELVEYRMCKHVFGNSPSPAIATYCLRKSVEESDSEVKSFVNRDFYVDDGLSSQPTVEKAVDLVQRTQKYLSASKLRLHKIASNSPEVLKQFPNDDLAKGLKDVDLDCGELPIQRSLGIVWSIENDRFMFKVDMSAQAVTKRGILSTINSLFDPLGFLAPVVLEGRLILRELVSTKVDWDETIPQDIARKWENWISKVAKVTSLDIRRSYFEGSISEMSGLELHMFADASVSAISAVVYVLGNASNGDRQIGFVLGKSKLAPEHGHSVPRLELCAAVLACQLYQCVSEQLAVSLTKVVFYTDSRVVLGYICNKTRRFYQYVSNRVQKILHVSSPNQWNHVPTELNPADIGSRGASVEQLKQSSWLVGPNFLLEECLSNPEHYPLMEPDCDKEIRPEVVVRSTKVVVGQSLARKVSKFSTFDTLVRALSTLRHIAVSYHKNLPCKGWHLCPAAKDVQLRNEVKLSLYRDVQLEFYSKEVECLSVGKALPRDSTILSLDPKLGSDGLLHVGGRLSRSKLPLLEKNPIVLPGKHALSRLLVEHHHNLVHHQGRTFTEGAVRSAGLWITGGKRLVSSVIQKCVVCRRLRGRFECQKMSDLPEDRVEEASPFSYVGVDVFGPWEVVARRTRGGHAASKRWAVLFTCLVLRAVHIEVLEDLSSSAFTNALRRFVSVRGKVKMYRSDRGTNFVGAIDNIQVTAINVEDESVKGYLKKSGSVWVFNSPHSSHMGGVWERMIGVARRILEAMLLGVKSLSHDVLVTLMAEVSAIINSRPIVPVSNDPEVPDVLSPSALLTQKLECDQVSLGNMDVKDLYRSQWQQVQYLANQFWVRWRKEYLQSLQGRRIWHEDHDPLRVGDVVLLRDAEVARNFWPMARVTRTFPSQDGCVRKVEVCVAKDKQKVFYTRPVVELVLLVSAGSS